MPDGNDLRIRQFVDQAAQAFATGRPLDAERIIRQAEAEAPQHPLVLNEVGKRLMQAGNPSGAVEALEQAAKGEPGNAIIWLNLAIALRALNRPEDEKAALDRSLAIEPSSFHALMQAASLDEIRGRPRSAAATYRTALQMIPRGLPLHMRPALDKAKAAIEANDRALESFLDGFLKDTRAKHADQKQGRFDRALDTLLQKRRVYRPAPSFLYVPQLPAIEFYEREEFPWLDEIEAATDDIRAELINVLADGPATLEPYVAVQGTPGPQWKDLNNSRRWGVFYLWKAGEAVMENQARCPKTVAALSGWPKCDLEGTAPTATFSILDAKTKIPPHVGVNNARLICHLPLIVPPGCGFRVGAETREWEPGKAFVFDDTIEHEAWNDSDQPRAVLIFDIWNPYMSPAERELVSALTVGVGEFYGELPDYIAGSPN
jgi:aspartyl/asparaginyl beta-hydroxylase (cupin superfamily)